MFEAKKKRDFALQSVMLWAFLWAFFCAAIAHSEAIAQQPIATGQNQSPKASAAATKPPDLAPLPNVAPANPTVTTPNPPALTQLDKPIVDNPVANKPVTNKPIADKSSDALTDLPASKRLAISVLAGVLTLIAALWIGARRD